VRLIENGKNENKLPGKARGIVGGTMFQAGIVTGKIAVARQMESAIRGKGDPGKLNLARK
jgi:hypothetical protein